VYPKGTSMPNIMVYRATVNFTNSISYSPQLDVFESEEFQAVSQPVVDTLESEFIRVPGNQIVTVVLIRFVEDAILVDVDVQSEDNSNDQQIQDVILKLIQSGYVGFYTVSPIGFQFHRIGTGYILHWYLFGNCSCDWHLNNIILLVLLFFFCSLLSVHREPQRPCRADEFTCISGECIVQEYLCDRRVDCADGSDENEKECGVPGLGLGSATYSDAPVTQGILSHATHTHVSSVIRMTSEGGRGTLDIHDVKESDQGAYTCEAINSRGMIFAIPDAVLILQTRKGPCVQGQFDSSPAGSPAHCLPCFCFGVVQECLATSRNRAHIRLEFDRPDDQKGVEVTVHGPPSQNLLAETQVIVNEQTRYLQLVDLSRHFRTASSYWSLPAQFRGNKVGSYRGYLRYRINYGLGRVSMAPLPDQPDVLLEGPDYSLFYKPRQLTQPDHENELEVHFVEGSWVDERDGHVVSREELLLVLAQLQRVLIRTVYEPRMVNVGLAHIVMDTTVSHNTNLGLSAGVEECRCPAGYQGLSCEECALGFTRVPSGPYLGTCVGCSCNGHSSTCDDVNGHCLRCQHNTEGSQCELCRPGFFGDPTQGRPSDCMLCPCPYTKKPNQFSDTCHLGTDGRPTCDACQLGYEGRRCERCADGYSGNPMAPGGRCQSRFCNHTVTRRQLLHPGVVGAQCDECSPGYFHLSVANPNGCLRCFCQGHSVECTSSSWSTSTNNNILYWSLPKTFVGDKVTAYGGSLRFMLRFEAQPGARPLDGADVVLIGQGLTLEYHFEEVPRPGVTTSYVVQILESVWHTTERQPCTREQLLSSLANIQQILIRLITILYCWVYFGSISDISLEVAVPHDTGLAIAVEVEECTCPYGYSGTSCQVMCFHEHLPPPCFHLQLVQSCQPGAPGCEQCEPGFYADPRVGQADYYVVQGVCFPDAYCQVNVEGRYCDTCKQGSFFLSPKNSDGCLNCFCMGVTGQCTSSNYHRHKFRPGDTQGVALVNRQRTLRIDSGFVVRPLPPGEVSYMQAQPLAAETLYWELPQTFSGDKITAYGGSLWYTLVFSAGPRATPVSDADVQIRVSTVSSLYPTLSFPVSSDVELPTSWQRLDGQLATREHLLMVLADMSEILVRAIFSTDAHSASLGALSMSVASPASLGPRGPRPFPIPPESLALEVEQCQCPHGYTGLSCQDCAPGYTRAGGGLYLELCEMCNCHGHSDSCHSETRACTNCLHHTMGTLCQACAPGYYGDATQGTPHDCQPCACPLTTPENRSVSTLIELALISRTPAPSYVLQRLVLSVTVGNVLFCCHEELSEDTMHVNLNITVVLPLHLHVLFPSPAGQELILSNIEPDDADVYICTCYSLHASNSSRTEIIYSGAPPRPIEVHIEEPSVLQVQAGITVTFICTATSQLPAYTLVWTRESDGMLPERAQDFNGILKLVAVRIEDTGTYTCTGSNMLGMDVGHAQLSVQGVSLRSEGAAVHDGVLHFLSVQPADEAEYVCHARNSAGEVQARATLFVIGEGTPQHPTISWHMVREGDTAHLFCRVAGEPHPTLNWRRLAGELPPQVMQSKQTYKYPHLPATYHPTAEPPEIPHPIVPDVWVEPPMPILAPGGTIELRCDTSAPPYSRISWYWNGGPLAENHQVCGKFFIALLRPGFLTSAWNQNPSYLRPEINVPSLNAFTFCITPSGFLFFLFAFILYVLTDNVQVSEDGTTLWVQRASVQNHGNFVCLASNAFGITRAVAMLSYFGSEYGKLYCVLFQVHIRTHGEAIALVCLSFGDNVILEMDYLLLCAQIDVAQQSDSGRFVCMAWNEAGWAEEGVDIIVEGIMGETRPTARMEQAEVTVVAGETATLTCHATGTPTPTIYWSKLRSPLPWQHRAEGSTLTLPRVGQQDSGQYICNASNALGSTQDYATLHVDVPPYASVIPTNLVVAVGEVLRLQCLAHGTPPLQLQWEKVNGSLPTRASNRDGILQINLATVSDSGTYRCLVRNHAGQVEALTTVAVRCKCCCRSSLHTPPAVRATPRIMVKPPGATTTLRCLVLGEPRPRLTWSRQGAPLPSQHTISENDLLNFSTTSFLSFLELPVVMISVLTEVQTVVVGGSVQFDCHALGDPPPMVHWSRVDGELPAHAVVMGGMLKLPSVHTGDAGTYRCTATNSAGSVQSQVTLRVHGTPQVSVQPAEQYVSIGESVSFTCRTVGSSMPDISWTKMDGAPPEDVEIDGGILTIRAVRREDQGSYLCRATNTQGSAEARAQLYVKDVIVPYFKQTPISYVSLPSIPDAYRAFRLRLTFRPDNPDGLVLYSGVREGEGVDFTSLGLVGGRPEFRFDAGSGMGVLRHPTPISLGQYHTVTIWRNLTQGSLQVNGETPVTGSSQGKFQGMDMSEEFYVGGVPEYSRVSQLTGLHTGFQGCIPNLELQGQEVDITSTALSMVGVENCPSCGDQPCQNGGRCREVQTTDYVCDCLPGFAGTNCELSEQSACHPGACSEHATCYSQGDHFSCRCHLGKFGHTCDHGELVTRPSFGSKSWLELPPIHHIQKELELELEFQAQSTQHGLLLYSGARRRNKDDFVALVLADGFVEFRYDLGSGLAVLRSVDIVRPGVWHRVHASRAGRNGALRIDDGPTTRGQSPGQALGLNLQGSLFLGGVASPQSTSPAVNSSYSLDGCIGEVLVNGKMLDVMYSYIASSDVVQCAEVSPCDCSPCFNGGSCLALGEFEFQCLCQDNYYGKFYNYLVESVRTTTLPAVLHNNCSSAPPPHTLLRCG
uniref:Heparan sulfate proteoglycan 2 n=1 Tax=Eptatretus burgeri TaxID=7764 RepID=A0A8C4X261_EPTBU